MLKKSTAALLLFIALFSFNSKTFGTTYTWTGIVSSDWNNASNWAPSGIPTTNDDVIIDGAGIQPVLDADRVIQSIQFSGASTSLNLNDHTLSISHTASFNQGIIDAGFIYHESDAGSFTSTQTTFNASIFSTCLNILLNQSIFQNTVIFTKLGGVNNYNLGGNTFKKAARFSHKANRDWEFAHQYADIFEDSVTFINAGNGTLWVSQNGLGNKFSRAVTFNNIGASSNIQVGAGEQSSTFYAGNIILNNTSTGSIALGNANSKDTLASGKTLIIGASGFSAGALSLRNFVQLGTTSQNLTFTGSAHLLIGFGTVFNGNVDFTSPVLSVDKATFNRTTTLTKNGNADSEWNGGAAFNSTCTINNSGNGNLLLAAIEGNTFEGSLTLNNNGSGYIQVAKEGDNTFNGNITVNCTNGVGIFFNQYQSGTSNLVSGKTIKIGAGGFNVGTLSLMNFRQNGNTSQSLTLTGTAVLQFGPASRFEGNTTVSSPSVLLNGCTFMRNATLTKTGNVVNFSEGANTFNGTTTITNSGNADWLFGSKNKDIFVGPVTFNNSGNAVLWLSHNGSGNKFGGTLTLNNTGASSAIYIGAGTQSSTYYAGNITVNNTSTESIVLGNVNSKDTLASSKTIKIGATGYASGTLCLRNFVQLGNTAQSLTLTGSAHLLISLGTVFNGNATFVSPSLVVEKTTFNRAATLTQNGSATNQWIGGTIFNSTSTINNSGTGSLVLAANEGNTYQGNTTINNTSTGYIQVAKSGVNTFNGNITISCTAGAGIFFNQFFDGTSVLANGKTIKVGASGFTNGTLSLMNFTQNGTTAQPITLTGTATLQFGPSAFFGGTVTASSPSVILNGCTFNRNATLTKTGNILNISEGGNVFNGTTTTITNSGNADWIFGNINKDNFNGPVTFNNSGNAIIWLSHNGSNKFNNTLTLNNTGASSSIYIGAGTQSSTYYAGNITVNNTSTGSIVIGNVNSRDTLANTRTLRIGSTGFTSGTLSLRNFVQTGTTAQTFTLTGTAKLSLDFGTVFNGSVNFASPDITAHNATFNGSATLQKTGSGNSFIDGGLVFNGNATLINNGAGDFYIGTSNNSQFNRNSTFTKSGTGNLYPVYATEDSFFGNMTFTSNNTIEFGKNGGTVKFLGTLAQSLTETTGTPAPSFKNIIMNKTSGDVSLSTPISIAQSLNLIQGNIVSTPTNLPTFENGATVTGTSDLSFVRGPVKKVGANPFVFPIGITTYQPLEISAPASATDAYTARYLASAQALGNAKDASLCYLSNCEYWTLVRNTGSTDVNVGLGWGPATCGVAAPEDMRIAQWNGATWKDLGLGSFAINGSYGRVVSAAAANVYTAFALGSATPTVVVNPASVDVCPGDAVALDASGAESFNWSPATYLNATSGASVTSTPLADITYTVTGISGQCSNFAIATITTNCNPIAHNTADNNNLTAIQSTTADGLSVKVYPNPAHHELNVAFILEENMPVMIEVMDVVGKKMLSLQANAGLGSNTININTQELSSGSYILVIRTNKGVSTQKFLKD